MATAQVQDCEISQLHEFVEMQPQQEQEQQPQPEQQPQQVEQEQANPEMQPNEDSSEEHIFEVQYQHPLEHVWSLWYLENDRSKHWKDMLNEITKIDSVTTFWSLYNTIKTPSELKIGCDYSMFKSGIKPMWEDEANIKGGRWLLTFGKSSKAELDRIWLDILLMMVGQTFDYSDEICGAVINIRVKANKISVWTADGSNEAAILEIGQKLNMVLHLKPHALQYQLHSDAMSKSNSGVRSIYAI